MKRRLTIIAAAALLASFCAYAGLIGMSGGRAGTDADTLPLGTLQQDGPATPEQVSLVLPITNPSFDSDNDATATCQYKATASSTWTDCHPLYKIRPDFVAEPPVGSVDYDFAFPVIDLSSGTSYDFRSTICDEGDCDGRTLTTSTRSLPASCAAANKTITAGSSSGTIQTAFDALNPGDTIQFQDGAYTVNNLTLNRSGTSGSPICIRGGTREGAVLSDSAGNILAIQEADYVIIENLKFVGSGVDNGVVTASTAISQSDSGYDTVNLTIRKVTATGVDVFMYLPGENFGLLAYDFTATGNDDWEQDLYANGGSGAPGGGNGTLDVAENLFWNDTGVEVTGAGNAVFNGTMEGFGDCTASADHSSDSYNNHFYRLELRECGDDFVEIDESKRNLTFYDSRVHNAANCGSLDPLFGGPFLFARNICVNTHRRQMFKWNGENAGAFYYNNTVLATRDGPHFDAAAWYQPSNGGPAQRSLGFENNIIVYRGPASDFLFFDQTVWNPIDWTHNAYYPDTGVQWLGTTYASLAAAQSGLPATTPVFSGSTHRMSSDVITVTNPFTTTCTLGSDANTEITTTCEFALTGGTSPKNAGVVIPGVTDGYSGAAPDMGAVIAGRAEPTRGDRSQGAAEGVPSYISALSSYEVLALDSVSNGKVTMNSVTPSEWAGTAASVIKPFSGGAGSPGHLLFVHGGGHSDGSNNGMYIFDFRGTTQPTGWTLPVISPVSAVVANTAAYSDGNPVSVHTYDIMAYVPSEDAVYRFGGAQYSSGGWTNGAWKYSVPDQDWIRLDDLPSDLSGTPGGTAIYDSATNRMLVVGGNNAHARWFDVSDDTGDPWDSDQEDFGGTQFTNTPIRGPGSEIIGVGQGHFYKLTVSFSGETISLSSPSTSGDTEIVSEDNPSGWYDSACGVYWIMGGGDGSVGWDNVYSVNATTKAFTRHTLTGDAIEVLTDMSRSSGRMTWLVGEDDVEWRAIGIVADSDTPAYIVKLPTGCP